MKRNLNTADSIIPSQIQVQQPIMTRNTSLRAEKNIWIIFMMY